MPLTIEGVSCSACVAVIERTLAQQEGFEALSLNPMTRQGMLQFDAGKTTLARLFAAITAVGYQPVAMQAVQTGDPQARERKLSLWRALVAWLVMMQVMMYSWPFYIAMPGDMSAESARLLLWAQWALCLPLILFSALPILKAAWRSALARQVSMDTTVALAILLTFGASTEAVFSGVGETWFDSLSMFLAFLLTARHVQLLVQLKAQKRMQNAASAVPQTATRLLVTAESDAATAASEMVPSEALRRGDLVRVPAGAVLPADGVLLVEAAALNEAMLTGESRPVLRQPGDIVRAGTVNLAGSLLMRVSASGQDTRAAEMLTLMQRAASERPRWARLADRFAPGFMLAVLVASALAWLGWHWVEPHKAFSVAVAVLIVTCPCALSLATPAALVAATGALARRGLMVRNPDAIERLANVTDVMFDKTGTLTRDALQLDAVEVLADPALWTRARVLQTVHALEAGSFHPVARAVQLAVAAESSAMPVLAVSAQREIAGMGVTGVIDGVAYRFGQATGRAQAQMLGQVGELSGPEGPIARLILREMLRGDAAACVAQLTALGLTVTMTSGDAPQQAQAVAAQVGIVNVHGAMTAEAKLALLNSRQAEGGRVLMVGDGLNDAPTLARADVSIAVVSGAPLAQQQADLVLLSDRLLVLAQAIPLARRTLAIVRQNLIWAAAYNFVCIPLALLGWLTPALAGLGMAGSSMFVILNAARLGRMAGPSVNPEILPISTQPKAV